MAKKIKILFVVLAALLLTGVLGVWYLTSTIDQAQLTHLIGSNVKQATGRELKISGPVRLTIFPSVGLIAEDISLSNAAWAKDPYFVKAKKLDVNIHLLPLFSQRIEISRIELNGVDIFLQSNDQRDANWILAAPLAQGVPSQSVQASKQRSDSNTFVAIQDFSVKNARITYRDGAAAPRIYQIQDLSLQESGAYTALKLDAQQDKVRFGVRGKITAIRKILDDWNQTPLKIGADLNIDINGKSIALKGDVLKKVDTLPSFDVNLSSKSFDLAPLLGGTAVAASGGKIPSKPHIKAPSPYFFSPEELPFDLLPVANGVINLSVAELNLPDSAPFKNLSAQIEFKDDRINLRKVNFQFGSGSAQAEGHIQGYQEKNPEIVAKGQANGYSLEQVLLDDAGSAQVKGGETQVAFDLRGTGRSLHQIMGSVTGKAQISIGQASIPTNYVNEGGDFLISLFDAVNPMRKKSNKTVLDCALAYLPVTNGLVSIKDTIGIETNRLDITLSGNINLKTESINLNIYPREKSGLTSGLDLANLVKLQGTIQNPELGINKAGVVNSAVAIGLGILTGGVSIVAENARSMSTKSYPCKTALHSWSEIYSQPK